MLKPVYEAKKNRRKKKKKSSPINDYEYQLCNIVTICLIVAYVTAMLVA
jgi:uncharacterized protein YutD